MYRPACLVAALLVLAAPVRAARLVVSWESLVQSGNLMMERGRWSAAVKSYAAALKQLEKIEADDIRTAIVYKDLSAAYVQLQKPERSRLNDGRASAIYRQEIQKRHLGGEYALAEPGDLSGVVLKPACQLCHENYRVVPIRYGEGNGYEGDVPRETDYRFTHKPGGVKVGSERWYCKSCKQRF